MKTIKKYFLHTLIMTVLTIMCFGGRDSKATVDPVIYRSLQYDVHNGIQYSYVCFVYINYGMSCFKR